MKITNKHNLPEGIVKAVTNDSYDKGNAHYSISQLIMPPQMLRLMQLHWNELTTDVADEIWKLFGSSVHYILDKSNQQIVEPTSEQKRQILEAVIDYSSKYTQGDPSSASDEEIILAYNGIKKAVENEPVEKNPLVNIEGRLYGSIGGIRISGKPDWYHTIIKQIEDYKVTQVYKVMKGDHSDWESQGNGYAWLLRENGEDPQTFKINAILKDWKPADAKRDPENYPQAPVEVVNIKLWKPLEQARFILDRIEKHESLKGVVDPEELFKIVPCTDSEKWHGTDTFAVKKRGGSRAVNGGVFTTIEEANQFLITKGADHFVEKRLGTNKRCEEYCLVKEFCAQRKFDIGEKDGHATVDLDSEPELPEEKPEVKPIEQKKKDIFADIDSLLKKKDEPIEEKESEPIKAGSKLEELMNKKDLTIPELTEKYDLLEKKAREKFETPKEETPEDTPEETKRPEDKDLLTDINDILRLI